MIEIKSISKRFGKLTVLDNISLSLRNGETISLIGPNGSGKTTLIKCLLGLVVPGTGSILFDGADISKQSQYRSNIGYMPQVGRFPENITIDQLFRMVRDIRRSNGSGEDHELIETFGLEAIKKKTMRTLSGGTRQKVSACLAFMFDAPVIILDEPTAGLDPLATEQLKDKIRTEKEKGKLILITSHILSDLDDLISQVVYLQDGKLLFHKAIEQLRTDTGEVKLSRAIAHVMLEQSKAQ